MLVQVPCIARMHASLSYRRKCTSSSPNTFTSCTCSTTIPCMGPVSIFDRIGPSHTHSPAGVRIIDTLRRISFETHLRSSIRCLVHETHAHTHPRYTRLILVLSPRIVTRIRVIGAVILTIRHRLLARIRGDTPSQSTCKIHHFRHSPAWYTHVIFGMFGGTHWYSVFVWMTGRMTLEITRPRH